jgi:hypothetical protein
MPPESAQPAVAPPNPAAPRHPRPLGGDTARQLGAPLVSLSGYVLNNRAERSHLSMNRKPPWIRAKMPGG